MGSKITINPGKEFSANMNDRDTYCDNMRKSMFDKLFFLPIIDADLFVDFGCADGSLIQEAKAIFPNANRRFIGYDLCETMVHRASVRNPEEFFTTNWNHVLVKPNSCLILSSVIHEALSYNDDKQQAEFWDRVWNSGFRYIVIRDMMPERGIMRNSVSEQIANIWKHAPKQIIVDWENVWGSLSDNRSLVHFLLTYQYVNGLNWIRELHENYFPLDIEEFLGIIPYNHSIIYSDHYTLPYFKNWVHNEFDINLVDRTHIKLILERK